MSDEDKSVPEAGKTDSTSTDPASSDAGESGKDAEARSNIPENLQGKSTTELVKMYGELERKLGEQSAQVNEAKKIRENMDLLAKAVYSKPDLAKDLDTAVRELTGQPSETKKDSPEKESDGEAEPQPSPQVSEIRRAYENQVIADFSDKYGLSKLKGEERQEAFKKIGNKLADLVDPSGTKTVDQVLSSVSLEKMPKLLEDAYWLTHRDALVDKGEVPQDFASIGRTSSSSVKSEGGEATLTDRERGIAERLGVDPEKYLKRKQEIETE